MATRVLLAFMAMALSNFKGEASDGFIFEKVPTNYLQGDQALETFQEASSRAALAEAIYKTAAELYGRGLRVSLPEITTNKDNLFVLPTESGFKIKFIDYGAWSANGAAADPQSLNRLREKIFEAWGQ